MSEMNPGVTAIDSGNDGNGGNGGDDRDDRNNAIMIVVWYPFYQNSKRRNECDQIKSVL